MSQARVLILSYQAFGVSRIEKGILLIFAVAIAIRRGGLRNIPVEAVINNTITIHTPVFYEKVGVHIHEREWEGNRKRRDHKYPFHVSFQQ